MIITSSVGSYLAPSISQVCNKSALLRRLFEILVNALHYLSYFPRKSHLFSLKKYHSKYMSLHIPHLHKYDFCD